jgi:hypothetical protein
MEQRREADPQLRPGLGHHGDGVAEHVLVAVDRVLFQPQGGQLGNELVGLAGVDQLPQAPRRVRPAQDGVEGVMG